MRVSGSSHEWIWVATGSTLFGNAVYARSPEESLHLTQDLGTSTWLVWVTVLLFIAIGGLLFYIRQLKAEVAGQNSLLDEQQKRVQLLTQHASDWIWMTDHNYRFTYVSPSIKALLGYEAEEVLGTTWEKVLHPGESERAYALDAHVAAAARRGEINQYKDMTVEILLRDKKNQLVWTETSMRIFFDSNGQYVRSEGSARNITERKQAEEAIRQLTFNDPLTHLPNRRLLTDRLKQAMAGCARHHQYCAVLLVDLDNFKYINDNHGYDNGDRLLQQIAQRLLTSLRESDTVARFGGDEFILISEYLGLDLVDAKQHAIHIAAKTLELFDQDFMLRDVRCHLTASIGVTLFNTDEQSVPAIIKQSDLAVCQAKAKGRNQFHLDLT